MSAIALSLYLIILESNLSTNDEIAIIYNETRNTNNEIDFINNEMIDTNNESISLTMNLTVHYS